MKNTHNIAILGFGVVGGGVADLITNNQAEIKNYSGAEVNIKRILDLRDFPDSPFGEMVTHNFDDILNDGEIDTVCELMGGSHPAYEYTMAALKAGKNVITSNKEVVASFGDEFLKCAKENGVSYRFEASVGGGIPALSPIINCVRQNKMREIRGILNGTTNYILTKMFTYGESFESALKDAQEKGYAERNPDADILGTDACRKITILTALATDKLVNVNDVHTEGITKIRANDVKAAEKIGMKIKLLGRCILDGEAQIMVAPFLMGNDAPLSNVSGVFNAIEVVAEPLGNVMFYGPGAGAGATASAVVGDLMQVIASGVNCKAPVFERTDYSPLTAFASFKCKNYVALSKGNEGNAEKFGKVTFIESEECAFITECMSEAEFEKASKGVEILSRIRLL